MPERRYLTPLEKVIVLNRQNDRCVGCGRKARFFIFDHRIQLWMWPEDERHKANHIDNFQALCRDCDKPKTARDATVRAKVKRLRRKHGPEPQIKSRTRKLRSRPFLPGKRKIMTRGFDPRFRRRMDGTVVLR